MGNYSGSPLEWEELLSVVKCRATTPPPPVCPRSHPSSQQEQCLFTSQPDSITNDLHYQTKGHLIPAEMGTFFLN